MFYRELGIILSVSCFSIFTPHNDPLRWTLLLISFNKGICEITEHIIHSIGNDI